MIADYVNDQVDVVSRAFLGLSVACARCHDHKFDPISDRRLLRPGRHLLQHPADPRARAGQHAAGARAAAVAGRARQGAGRETPPTSGGGRSWSSSFPTRPTAPTSPICATSSPARPRAISWRPAEYRQHAAGPGKRSLWPRLARRRGLHAGLLAGLVDYLGRVAAQPSINRHPTVRDAAAGTTVGSRLEKARGRARARARRTGRATQEKRVRLRAKRRRSGTRLAHPPAGRRSVPRHRRRRPGRCSGRTAPACRRTPGRQTRSRPGEGERRHQWPCQGRAPVRRRVPARTAAQGAPDRQPVRRLPAAPTRPAPASACSAGKIPTSASMDSA